MDLNHSRVPVHEMLRSFDTGIGVQLMTVKLWSDINLTSSDCLFWLTLETRDIKFKCPKCKICCQGSLSHENSNKTHSLTMLWRSVGSWELLTYCYIRFMDKNVLTFYSHYIQSRSLMNASPVFTLSHHLSLVNAPLCSQASWWYCQCVLAGIHGLSRAILLKT